MNWWRLWRLAESDEVLAPKELWLAGRAAGQGLTREEVNWRFACYEAMSGDGGVYWRWIKN